MENTISTKDAEFTEFMRSQLKTVDRLAMNGQTIPIKVFERDLFGKGANAYYWPENEDEEEHYALVKEGMSDFIGTRLIPEASMFSTIAHEVRHRLQCNNRIVPFTQGKSPTNLYGVDRIFDGTIKLKLENHPGLEFDASVIEYVTMLAFNKLKIKPSPEETSLIVKIEPSTIHDYLQNLKNESD